MVAAFAKELQRSLKWRAKALLGLGTVQEAFTGLVVAVQRSDSALRLNVHLYVLALDGVYVRGVFFLCASTVVVKAGSRIFWILRCFSYTSGGILRARGVSAPEVFCPGSLVARGEGRRGPSRWWSERVYRSCQCCGSTLPHDGYYARH